MPMVRWHGHACVEIRRLNGYTVVFDPHDGLSIGLPRPDVKADLVLITHDHFDHNAAEIVSKPTTRVFKQFYGEARIDDIVVHGYKTYHDKFQGKRRGENTIYIVELDGYRIAHLGDLGHIPDKDVLEKLAEVDLLIIPVGGVYTIYPDEAWKIIEETKPKNVLPVHYWVEGLRLPLHPLKDFIAFVKKYSVKRLDKSSFDLQDYENSIIVPKPPY